MSNGDDHVTYEMTFIFGAAGGLVGHGLREDDR
jgi:hypothetical protein